MNVDLGIWQKLVKLLKILLVIAALLLIAAKYLPLIQQNERMRKAVQRLDTQTKKEIETERQLKASIDALRNDPKAVERFAREQLGYARTGEVVVHFKNSPTNGAVAR